MGFVCSAARLLATSHLLVAFHSMRLTGLSQVIHPASGCSQCVCSPSTRPRHALCIWLPCLSLAPCMLVASACAALADATCVLMSSPVSGLSAVLSLPAASAWAAAADASGAHRCIWLTCLGLAALARFSITQFTHFGAATALVLLTEVFSAPICVLVDATVTALATHVSASPPDLPAALAGLL